MNKEQKVLAKAVIHWARLDMRAKQSNAMFPALNDDDKVMTALCDLADFMLVVIDNRDERIAELNKEIEHLEVQLQNCYDSF